MTHCCLTIDGLINDVEVVIFITILEDGAIDGKIVEQGITDLLHVSTKIGIW